MTKFITYYNLYSIPEPKDILGISPDKEEGNIITTLVKNIVIIKVKCFHNILFKFFQ